MIARTGSHAPSFIEVVAIVIHFVIVTVLQNVAARLNEVDLLIRQGVLPFGQHVMCPHSGVHPLFSSTSLFVSLVLFCTVGGLC